MIGQGTVYDIMSPQFSALGADMSYLPLLAIAAALGYLLLATVPARRGWRLTVPGVIGLLLVLLPVIIHGFLTGANLVSAAIGLLITATVAFFVIEIRKSRSFWGRLSAGFSLGTIILATVLPAVSMPAFTRQQEQVWSEVLTASFDRQAKVIAASGEVSFTDPVWVEPDERQALRDRYETFTLGLWRAVWWVISDEPAPAADSRPWQIATVGVRGGEGVAVLTCQYRDGALAAVAPLLANGPDLRGRMPALNEACPATAETDSARFVPATDIVGALPGFAPKG